MRDLSDCPDGSASTCWGEGGPTPAFSGAAGDLSKPARTTARHHVATSRPAHGPRQRRPLQSTVGPLRISATVQGLRLERLYYLHFIGFFNPKRKLVE